MIVFCGVHHDRTAHAMAGNDDAMRVNAQPLRIRRIAEIGQHGIRILEVLRKVEGSRAAPRAAIVERYHVPARAPDSLREIEIFSFPGRPWQMTRVGCRAAPEGW